MLRRVQFVDSTLRKGMNVGGVDVDPLKWEDGCSNANPHLDL